MSSPERAGTERGPQCLQPAAHLSSSSNAAVVTRDILAEVSLAKLVTKRSGRSDLHGPGAPLSVPGRAL